MPGQQIGSSKICSMPLRKVKRQKVYIVIYFRSTASSTLTSIVDMTIQREKIRMATTPLLPNLSPSFTLITALLNSDFMNIFADKREIFHVTDL